ncbi:MAG: hypothetical protein GY863_08865 [bacterium]|nr:hypothetical protein [bacterium]
MKRLTVIYIAALSILFNCVESPDSELKGDYFGQNPPGDIPEIFAPGMISTRYHEHSSPCFSSDFKEMFFTLSCDQDHVIMHTRLENGRWTTPEAASFSGEYSDDKARFSLDGTKLFFRSKRPLTGNGEPQNEYHDWMVEKSDSDWGTPIHITAEEVIETRSKTRYMNINTTGENNGLDIYISKYADGKYSEPEKMGFGINTENTDAVMFVDPDEKYILLASMGRPDQIGIMDIYISYQRQDKTWTNAINLGNKINRPGEISRFPAVSPDERYLFFWNNRLNNDLDEKPFSDQEQFLQKYDPWAPENGRDGDIYWVNAKIIEGLKPDDIK